MPPARGEVAERRDGDAAGRRVVGGVERRVAARMVDGEDGNARLPHRPRDRVVRGRIVEILYVEIDLAADGVGRVVHRRPSIATILVEEPIDRQGGGPDRGTLPQTTAHGGPGRH